MHLDRDFQMLWEYGWRFNLFTRLHAASRIGSESRPRVGPSPYVPCYISLSSYWRGASKGTVDFLPPMYTVAVNHQINFTTNKLSLLNKTKQCPQAIREYT
jgi:hypothetical protein